MRRVLMTLMLCLVATSCYAKDIDMEAIRMIESSGCKFLVGDGGKALGCYQLHEGVIKDYNRAFGTAYLHNIAMNEKKAYEIANWYMNLKIPKMLRYKGTKDTPEARLTAWNMGIGKAWKGDIARDYVEKYRRITNAHEDAGRTVEGLPLTKLA